jgi:hypothetical protein
MLNVWRWVLMYCIITIVALDYTHYKQRAAVFRLDSYKVKHMAGNGQIWYVMTVHGAWQAPVHLLDRWPSLPFQVCHRAQYYTALSWERSYVARILQYQCWLANHTKSVVHCSVQSNEMSYKETTKIFSELTMTLIDSEYYFCQYMTVEERKNA